MLLLAYGMLFAACLPLAARAKSPPQGSCASSGAIRLFDTPQVSGAVRSRCPVRRRGHNTPVTILSKLCQRLSKLHQILALWFKAQPLHCSVVVVFLALSFKVMSRSILVRFKVVFLRVSQLACLSTHPKASHTHTRSRGAAYEAPNMSCT